MSFPGVPRSVEWTCLVAFGASVSGCGDAPSEAAVDIASWQLVLEELPGAVISVSGTAPDDVWFAGSALDDGGGALVLHYDGERFERVITEVEADFWWVHAVSPDQIYFGGTGGVIVRYDGERFQRMQTPGTDTVFGIWAMDATTAWAVGGDPSRDERAFVWVLDASGAWVSADAPDPGVSSYFKVWGSGADDVRVVGADGAILHSAGPRFSSAASPVETSLTTVHVGPDGTYAAVGGFGDGVIVEDAGTGWKERTPADAPKQLYGVWLGADAGVAVGANGTILERTAEAWIEAETDLSVTLDLHAVWIDARGTAWAVGGDLVSSPMKSGLVLARGASAASSAVDGLSP